MRWSIGPFRARRGRRCSIRHVARTTYSSADSSRGVGRHVSVRLDPMVRNTLQAMQIGLQVTGNNIANANTPGFVRQEVIYSPAPVQKIGNLMLGLGVQVDAIVDKIDKFVHDRLVGARGDRAGAEVQEEAYTEIENLLNGLSGETDLSTVFTNFFNSIGEVLDDPSDAAARNLVITQGDTLATTLNNLSSRAHVGPRGVQRPGHRVPPTKSTRSPKRFASSTCRSPPSKASGASVSDAGGLRVERQNGGRPPVGDPRHHRHRADQRRARTSRSAANSWCSKGSAETVEVDTSTSEDGIVARHGAIRRHELAARIRRRRTARPVRGPRRDRRRFSRRARRIGRPVRLRIQQASLARAGARRLRRADERQRDRRCRRRARRGWPGVHAGQRPFSVAGLQHGRTTSPRPTTSSSSSNGLDDDTTLNDLAAALDAIDGISATITSAGKLEITSDSNDTEFAFDGDTSGVLAALGLNTFFTGSTARDIGVNGELRGLGNEAKFAASGGGLGTRTDSANALGSLEVPGQVARFGGRPDRRRRLRPAGQRRSAKGPTVAGSIAEGFRVFEDTLDGQLQAVAA